MILFVTIGKPYCFNVSLRLLYHRLPFLQYSATKILQAEVRQRV